MKGWGLLTYKWGVVQNRESPDFRSLGHMYQYPNTEKQVFVESMQVQRSSRICATTMLNF